MSEEQHRRYVKQLKMQHKAEKQGMIFVIFIWVILPLLLVLWVALTR